MPHLSVEEEKILLLTEAIIFQQQVGLANELIVELICGPFGGRYLKVWGEVPAVQCGQLILNELPRGHGQHSGVSRECCGIKFRLSISV